MFKFGLDRVDRLGEPSSSESVSVEGDIFDMLELSESERSASSAQKKSKFKTLCESLP